MPTTIRRALRAATLTVACALALAACSNGGTATTQDGAATPATGTEFPRTVMDAMGSTEIPTQPKRVVVLDTGELDTVISLGVTPVGAVTTDVSSGFPSYLAEATKDVKHVGTITEPNLEAIAALAPDLILSSKVRHEALHDKLSLIAPTVFAETTGAVWKDNLRLDAEALGMEKEAQVALKEYEANAAALGHTLGDPKATTVRPVRFVAGTIRAYTPASFIGTVLSDVGVSQPPLPVGKYPTFAEVSPENLSMAEADVVLYASYGDAAKSGEQSVLAGPLWSRLGAVQSSRAHAVDGDVFYLGIGLTAANRVLKDLQGMLAP
ncbi:MAG: ABC transporter substrate-binding protein [Mycobacteriaceae bacterium]